MFYIVTYTHKTILEDTPIFPTEVNDASAFFDSPVGRIKSSWERKGDGITFAVTLPEEVKGEIILPKGYAFENGNVILPAASGEYKIIKQQNLKDREFFSVL